MQHLTAFLTRLQTFELRIIQQEVYTGTGIGPDNKTEIIVYDLKHETPYYDSFSFKSELRVMKDMALLDLLTLDGPQTRVILDQVKKLQDRFRTFWQNYHQHYSGYEQKYKPSYLFSIRLDELFIVHNLQPSHADITISEEFVETLSDSVKLREQFLKELIREAEEHLDKQEQQEPVSREINEIQEEPKATIDNEDTRIVPGPRFSDGTVDQLFPVLKAYFDPADHPPLQKLLHENQPPENPLLFLGNGNQLADAFKQLYEANLIVGCSKAELEKWITLRFLYQYKNLKKEYTEGYLNGIISSDIRPCRSPILEVKKQDGRYTIFPTIRGKRNAKY